MPSEVDQEQGRDHGAHALRPAAWWTYLNDGPVTVELNIALVDHTDGTLLTSRFDAHPHGLFRLAFLMFMAMMRREEARNMQLLKNALEARPNPSAAHTP